MWKQPWGYAEGWVICAGLLITGFGLQLITGPVQAGLFQYPVNVAGGLIFLLVLCIGFVVGRKITVVQWFSGLTASITSLSALLSVVLVMGFVGPGIERITMSWPFILLFLYFLFVLGFVTLKRIVSFRWRDVPFMLNHVGLFITLLAAILGNGDLRRLRMTVPLENPEWRASDEKNEMIELPLAIELRSFTSISGAVDYIEDRCYSFLDYRTIPGGHYIRNSKIKGYKNSPISIYPLVEFIRDIKTRILPPKEVIMGDRQLERDAENWIKGWTIQFNINNLNDKFVESHRTVYDRTISMLKDMIEYCKEEKLRLVLVIPPMHRSLCRKFPSVAKEQLIDSFITEANGGETWYFDCMEEPGFSDDKSLFRNCYYLNKRGALLFTKYIMDKIDNK